GKLKYTNAPHPPRRDLNREKTNEAARRCDCGPDDRHAGPGPGAGRMVVDTSIDRMTGKAAAAVTWTAIDSVHSRYAYLPTLVARCSPHGSIDVYLTGVPAHNSSRHDILGVETGSDLRVDVKLDGWKKPKGSKLGEFTVQNDEAIWYFNGK